MKFVILSIICLLLMVSTIFGFAYFDDNVSRAEWWRTPTELTMLIFGVLFFVGMCVSFATYMTEQKFR